MQLPTIPAPILAALRHVPTFIGGAVAAAATLHFIPQSDAATLVKDVNQISGALATLAAAGGSAAFIIMGWFAHSSAKPENQLPQVQAAADAGKLPGVAAVNVVPK